MKKSNEERIISFVAFCLLYGNGAFFMIIRDLNQKNGLPQSRLIKSVVSWIITTLEIYDFAKLIRHHGKSRSEGQETGFEFPTMKSLDK